MAAFVGSPVTGSASAATTADTTSKSITNGNLIALVVRQQSSNARTWTPSVSTGTAITWFSQGSTTLTGARIQIWYGIAAATESAVFRVTASSADTFKIVAYEVSGFDTGTPIRGARTETNSSTTTNHDLLGTGVDVLNGDVFVGALRLTSGASITLPSTPGTPTADLTEGSGGTAQGGVYSLAFAADTTGVLLTATSGTARTSATVGIVVANVAAAASNAGQLLLLGCGA